MPEPDTTLPISWAQHWEDVRLWRVLQSREPGFYVDVGAMDPLTDTVTRVFYDLGWSGLDVEPDPDYADKQRLHRPRDTIAQVAAGASRGHTTLHIVAFADGSPAGLTTVEDRHAQRHANAGMKVRDIAVDVVPLAELMAGTAAEDPARFHFLKLDVEGHEHAVLTGAGLDRYRPLVVVMEAREPGRAVDSYAESEAILVAAKYVQVADDGLNRWYVRAEDEQIGAALAPPINPLTDGFPRRGPDVANEQLLATGIDELTARVLDVEARVVGLEEDLRHAQIVNDRLSDEVSGLRSALDGVVNSRSWKLTAPVRAAARGIRRDPPG